MIGRLINFNLTRGDASRSLTPTEVWAEIGKIMIHRLTGAAPSGPALSGKKPVDVRELAAETESKSKPKPPVFHPCHCGLMIGSCTLLRRHKSGSKPE